MNAEIRTERAAYQPGETIRGSVTWHSEKPPSQAEIRLFWQTKGKGSRDSETVEVQAFELPQPQDSRDFVFTAPAFPPSFSGRLISLLWGLELVLEPGGSQAIDLVIGPDGVERDLRREEWLQIPEPGRKIRWFRKA